MTPLVDDYAFRVEEDTYTRMNVVRLYEKHDKKHWWQREWHPLGYWFIGPSEDPEALARDLLASHLRKAEERRQVQRQLAEYGELRPVRRTPR